ncbi:MAG TPA: hypothetical protein VHZ24_07660 [Pirellulales bacterium]|jgi:hypothetical protein|nr:hypothetical protein [Pirellulales bacterium]
MDRISRSPGGATVAPRTGAEQLASNIARCVQLRTGQAIRDLRVKIDTQGVRLQGRCLSYYSKQLAQEAVMELAQDVSLMNDIEVA